MNKKKSNGKLTEKQLDKYRQLLLEKRREILGSVECIEQNIFQSGGELSSMPVHLADIGSDNFEQEFSLGLMAEEKKILVEIDHALARIDEGTYGICEGLGIPIEQPRLEAIPWTRYSLEHAKKVEKNRGFHASYQRPLDIDREEDFKDDVAEEEDETEDTDTDVPEVEGEILELPEEDNDDIDSEEDVPGKGFKE
jgi:RNA polymerase-binding transcription factor DksA